MNHIKLFKNHHKGKMIKESKYTSTKWGQEKKYGIYPEHPFVGKSLADLLENTHELPPSQNRLISTPEYKMDFLIKEVRVEEKYDIGYIGTINTNSDHNELRYLNFFTDNDDTIKFIFSGDELVMVEEKGILISIINEPDYYDATNHYVHVWDLKSGTLIKKHEYSS